MTDTRLTSNNVLDRAPSFSPDGKKISFCTYGYGDDGLPDGIFTMNADGSDRTPLGAGAGCEQGTAFSPEGDQIAFDAIVEPGTARNIFRINADGTGTATVLRVSPAAKLSVPLVAV